MSISSFRVGGRALAVLAAGALFVFAESSVAAPLHAAVAKVSTDGTINLLEERLVDHFPNGLPVAETYVDISNGFLRLVRKGFKLNGDCVREVATLVDANGASVVAIGVIAPQQLWLVDKVTIVILGCSDNGCHKLKNVVPLGEPPLVYAKCDTSDGPCECHVNDGSGDSTVSGGFCTSSFTTSVLAIESWVLHPFIE